MSYPIGTHIPTANTVCATSPVALTSHGEGVRDAVNSSQIAAQSLNLH